MTTHKQDVLEELRKLLEDAEFDMKTWEKHDSRHALEFFTQAEGKVLAYRKAIELVEGMNCV